MPEMLVKTRPPTGAPPWFATVLTDAVVRRPGAWSSSAAGAEGAPGAATGLGRTEIRGTGSSVALGMPMSCPFALGPANGSLV